MVNPLRICLLMMVMVCAQPVLAQPNILLITSEDNGPELGCYGDPYARTPHLDALAERGVRFENASVPYSVCSPSRGAIFTGMYPHQNGQMGLATHHFAMYRAWPVIPTFLHGRGYRTGLIGKLHVNPASAFTFDFKRHNGSNFGDRDIRAFADAARSFFDAGDEPFFLMVNYPDAHFPLHRQQHGWPIEPQTGGDVEVMPWVGATSTRLREFAADYYNCLSRLDSGIGMLLEELQASGKHEETLIIYLGDHGAQFSRGKTSVYEAGLRVPMIVYWPGESEAGLVPEQLVSSLDLFPTILEALEVPAEEWPEHLVGHSLLPITRAASDEVLREYRFGERSADSAVLLYPQRCVRDARYKLIHSPVRDRHNILHDLYRDRHNAHFIAGTSQEEVDDSGPLAQAVYARYRHPPEYELYDLETDPHEFHNLAHDPAYAEVKRRLTDALAQWQRDTRDPFAREDLARRFMAEMDATAEQGRRSPEGGWGYLDDFDAFVWPDLHGR